MAPKPEWQDHWAAHSSGRRLKYQRDVAMHAREEVEPYPEVDEPTATTYNQKEHSKQCLARWGQTPGVDLEVPGRTPLQDYHQVHWRYALAPSFVPDRHPMMILGRPLVVP